MAQLRKIGKKGNYFAYFYDRTRSPKRKSYPLRTTRKDVARRRLTKLERQYESDEFDPWFPQQYASEIVSASEAIERFIEAKEHLRPATLETYQTVIDAWSTTLPAGIRLRDISGKYIKPYVLDGDVKTSTQRMRYRHLRAFLNWCIEAALIDESPLENVRKPKKQKKQVAFLSTDDLERLLRSIDAHQELVEGGRKPDDTWLKDMVRVAVTTGLRRGELVRLRWQDVDLRQELLTVRSRAGEETKSGDERQLPLRGDALDVLARLHEERTSDVDGPVFTDARELPIKPNRVSKRFKFFVRKARLDKRLHFHSLRHTCGSWLAMQGVPQRVIQGILGHGQAATTEIYMHLAPNAMAAALEETFE